MPPFRKTILSIYFILSTGQAFQYEQQERFFTDLQESLSTVYRKTSGDSTRLTVDSLLQWRHSMEDIANLPSFQKIYARFIARGGRKNTPTAEILNWEKQRIMAERVYEDSIKRLTLSTDSHTVDSIICARELKKNISRPYDVEKIPFGINRDIFPIACENTARLPLLAQDDHFYIEGYPIGDNQCMVSFYFDRMGRYIRCRIEGYPARAKNLDKTVRPLADALTKYATKLGGPPLRRERIGYYDIKPASPAVIAYWKNSSQIMTTGILQTNNLFVAYLEITTDLTQGH